jgi:hypothetical protein
VSEMKYVNLQPLTPTIPKGWRRLRHKEKRRKMDRVWSYGEGPWCQIAPTNIGLPYHHTQDYEHYVTIRRIRPRKKAGK